MRIQRAESSANRFLILDPHAAARLRMTVTMQLDSALRMRKDYGNVFQGAVMKSSIALLLAALALLSACETLQGAGRDLRKVGNNLEDVAKSATP